MSIEVKQETPPRLEDYVPEELRALADPQTAIPAIAKDRRLLALINEAVQQLPTSHRLYCRDARTLDLPAESVHLVLTSPPYWTLKEYRDTEGQLGHIDDYDEFLDALDLVWQACYSARSRRSADLCCGRCMPVSAQEQWSAHRCSVARVNSGTLPANRLRQPGTDHLA